MYFTCLHGLQIIILKGLIAHSVATPASITQNRELLSVINHIKMASSLRTCAWRYPCIILPLRLSQGRSSGSVLCRGVSQYEPFLKHVQDPEQKEVVARILEVGQRAADRWSVAASDFYYPPAIGDALIAIKSMAGLQGIPWGGHPNAERCRLLIGHPDVIEGMRADPQVSETVAVLQVEGNFLFDSATHRDFLGACLGTGIEREKVGDIIVQADRGAQIIVCQELVAHLEQSLTQVRTVPVKTTPLASLTELRVPPPKMKDIRTTEASLRIDAVASAAFGMSRSKMTDLVKSGDVRVNWKPITKPSAEVQQGDMISVTGKGRCEVKEVMETAKGRFALNLVRFV